MNWLPKRTIVVPIDFSDDSFSALEAALNMIDDPAHIHVIHVLQELSPLEPGEVWGRVDHESRSENVKQELGKRLVGDKYAGIPIDVAFGDPGSEIAEFAKEVGAELIVLPSHGRTGLKRLLIGSVAERVVRLAHCPVLVLRN